METSVTHQLPIDQAKPKRPRFSISPAHLAILPATVLFTLFVLIPAIGNLFFSFTDYLGNVDHINWIGFDHYVRAFTSDWGEIQDAIVKSIIFAIGVTSIQNGSALFLAVLVNMKIRFRNFYRMIIFMPTILGVIVIGLSWRLILNPIFGPVNEFLGNFDAKSGLLGEPDIALYLVILIQVWASVGYAMVIYIAGLQSIPEEMYEAASIDGASPMQQFTYITLPLLRPAVTINILLSLIGSLKLFQVILITTSGGPAQATTTLSLKVFQELTGSTGGSMPNHGYSAALSVLHFGLMFVVIVAVQWYLSRSERYLE